MDLYLIEYTSKGGTTSADYPYLANDALEKIMKRYSFINTSVKITVLTVLGNDNLFTQRKHFYRLSFSV